ncbi:glycosyltransferase [Paenibacillus woosongensis]|uniref:Glycosyltransferase n=1 Tax=Paenibacillus woosongensis TaxID=307580 RepID=A0AA95L2B5_9BACL|nr:glycosyltransferase [Paenibacillus woosongensis]WHX50201.1 glycosyltransferase [Paenibacillus woosongensis]
MKYSIIIPTYNQCLELRACLNSFIHQNVGDNISFEVIVIDDGSTDDTSLMLEKINVPYELKSKRNLRSKNSSRSQTRNIGVDLSDGDVLIFIDGDHVVQPNFIQSHHRYHQVEQNIVLCGLRCFVDPSVLEFKNFDVESLNDKIIDWDARIEIIKKYSGAFGKMATAWHLCFSCNLSVRREHFVKLGGFDPNFTGWGLEDCELGYRFKKYGLKIAADLTPESMIYHIGVPKRVYTDEIFNGWMTNYNYFKGKYSDDLSVALQKLIGDRLNPQKQTNVDYLVCYTNFECASKLVENSPLPGTPIKEHSC